MAPGIRQSGELMQKFDEFRSAVELPSDYLDEDTKLSVKFKNKNRFMALPGSEKTIRGISAVTLLLKDGQAGSWTYSISQSGPCSPSHMAGIY